MVHPYNNLEVNDPFRNDVHVKHFAQTNSKKVIFEYWKYNGHPFPLGTKDYGGKPLIAEIKTTIIPQNFLSFLYPFNVPENMIESKNLLSCCVSNAITSKVVMFRGGNVILNLRAIQLPNVMQYTTAALPYTVFFYYDDF